MVISSDGLAFIKKHEKFMPKAYDDAKPYGDVLPLQGTLTIGYGHTKNVYVGQEITEKQAEELLRQDLEWVERLVNGNLQVSVEQHQYDALCSHAFNTGKASETLYRYINNGYPIDAIGEFWTSTYVTAHGFVGKVSGLVKRRTEEFEMFIKKNDTGILTSFLISLAVGILFYLKK